MKILALIGLCVVGCGPSANGKITLQISNEQGTLPFCAISYEIDSSTKPVGSCASGSVVGCSASGASSYTLSGEIEVSDAPGAVANSCSTGFAMDVQIGATAAIAGTYPVAATLMGSNATVNFSGTPDDTSATAKTCGNASDTADASWTGTGGTIQVVKNGSGAETVTFNNVTMTPSITPSTEGTFTLDGAFVMTGQTGACQ